MSEPIRLEYTVPGDDFARAGEASADLKATLKKLGVPAAAVRRISIALYEGCLLYTSSCPSKGEARCSRPGARAERPRRSWTYPRRTACTAAALSLIHIYHFIGLYLYCP